MDHGFNQHGHYMNIHPISCSPSGLCSHLALHNFLSTSMFMSSLVCVSPSLQFFTSRAHRFQLALYLFLFQSVPTYIFLPLSCYTSYSSSSPSSSSSSSSSSSLPIALSLTITNFRMPQDIAANSNSGKTTICANGCNTWNQNSRWHYLKIDHQCFHSHMHIEIMALHQSSTMCSNLEAPIIPKTRRPQLKLHSPFESYG